MNFDECNAAKYYEQDKDMLTFTLLCYEPKVLMVNQ